MDFQLAFHILQIEQTKDEGIIREAYYALLSSVHPEEDPEGFQKVRQAYETALEYARKDEQKKKKKPVTDIDFFMEKVQDTYNDISRRFCEDEWKELLKDPLCEGLDTSIEVRQRMICFLMDHIFLTHEVWVLLDQTFEIVEDIPQLKQEYPENFLAYVARRVQNDDEFPYSSLVYTTTNKEAADPDKYLSTMMDLKNQVDSLEFAGIDDEESKEQKKQALKKCQEQLLELAAYGVFHFHTDVEILRTANYLDDEAMMNSYLQKCQPYVEQNNYAAVHVGEAIWKNGDQEGAYEIWKKIIEKRPDHYRANYNCILYTLKKEDYFQAKQEILNILEIYDEDQRVLEHLKQVNSKLIEILENKVSLGEEDEHYPGYETVTELGWCYYQNEMLEKAIDLLLQHEPTEDKDAFIFHNLISRCYYASERYEEALPHILKWKELLWAMEDDGTEETRRHLSRKIMIESMLARCYFGREDKEAALSHVDQAYAMADNETDRLGCLHQKAGFFCEWKEYEKVVDLCDQILEADSHYFPAVVLHQKACFELCESQAVVDDYFKARELYPMYYLPYCYAMQVFFFHKQYEDATKVLQEAKNQGVFISPKMKLFEAKILRNVLEDKEDKSQVVAILEELTRLQNNKDQNPAQWDIDDDSEIDYEKALIKWDENHIDETQKYLESAIAQNPNRMQYRLVMGDLLCELKKYEQAIDSYTMAQREYLNEPGLYFGLARCYSGLNNDIMEMQMLQKVVSLRDVYSDACEKLAELYRNRYNQLYHKSDLDQAIELATRQLQASPSCYYYVFRGLIYLQAFQIELAMEDFRTALKENEDDWAAWNNLGCCYKYRGEFEKAIQMFQRAVECLKKEQHKNILPYSNMADCYEALGKYEEAIHYYILDRDEMGADGTAFYEEIADLYTYLGKYTEAEKFYKKLNQDLECHLAEICIREGNFKKAIKKYQKYLEQYDKKSKSQRVYAHKKVAHMFRDELGMIDESIHHYRTALFLEKDSEEAFTIAMNLAKAYFMKRDFENARQTAQKAIEFFNDCEYTREEYIGCAKYTPVRLAEWAWIEVCLGNIEKGIAMFESMDQYLRCRQCRRKKCFDKCAHLAEVYTALGNEEMAVHYWEEALERNPDMLYALIRLNRIKKKRTLF